MSKISYRPRGGEEGIEVTTEELIKFSNVLGLEFRDQVMPIPSVSIEEQRIRLKHCPSHDNEIYWETETGSHGWCCEHCGEVVQWG